jgi:antitoxin PrlF
LATTVTVKGQVTLPKSIREAAGIRPGDRVEVRARAEGGVVIERAERNADAYLRRLEDVSRRRPIKDRTTDEIMAITRGED